MNLICELKKNPFLLAPMAGITDRAFRSFMKELGCGIVTTELVSATGLKYNSEKTLRIMEFETSQHPIGIQIFGDSIEDLKFAAKKVEEMGADFVDLNFGCPVPKVVKKGGGSAILKDLIKVKEVFRAVKSTTQLPVTVKIRTGWDDSSKNANEVVQIAYDEGLTWVSIHGRTRAQGYSGLADWDYIREVKQSAKIPIIGNGDIHTASSAVDKLCSSLCDGAMIGRGALKNPWIFQEALSIWEKKSSLELNTPSLPPLTENTMKTSDVHRDFLKMFSRLKFHYEKFCVGDERVVALQMKKLAAWYSSGYPESSLFRKIIFQTQSLSELNSEIMNYFSKYQFMSPKDTSHESFLMGGHG